MPRPDPTRDATLDSLTACRAMIAALPRDRDIVTDLLELSRIETGYREGSIPKTVADGLAYALQDRLLKRARQAERDAAHRAAGDDALNELGPLKQRRPWWRRMDWHGIGIWIFVPAAGLTGAAVWEYTPFPFNFLAVAFVVAGIWKIGKWVDDRYGSSD